MERLTSEQIDALSLDELRAECAKAMGWKDVSVVTALASFTNPEMGKATFVRGTPPDAHPGSFFNPLPPDYPHDMAAAWRLSDVLPHWECDIGKPAPDDYRVMVWVSGNQYWGFTKVLAESISRAFLKAIHAGGD